MDPSCDTYLDWLLPVSASGFASVKRNEHLDSDTHGAKAGVLLGGINGCRVRTGRFFWARDLLKTEMGPLLAPLPKGRKRPPAATAEGPSASSAALGRIWTSELTLGLWLPRGFLGLLYLLGVCVWGSCLY